MIALAVGGVSVALTGLALLVGTLWPPDRPHPQNRVVDVPWGRIGAAAAGAGLAVLVTWWPVAAAGGAAVGWYFPQLLRDRRGGRVEARTEAIAAWCELLRDAAGTARGIEGLLVATASSAPAAIRPEVKTMARRLEFDPIGPVLDRLADDLDHPLGDLVVTALRLAATAGSSQVRQVLGDLASAAHAEAAMHRRVDVARQRPRSTMRLVAAVVAAFITGLALFARDYLAPYATPIGQVMLLVVAAHWAVGFWWMHRMGRVPQVERFMATDAEGRP